MTRFIIIRHGYSQGNKEKRFSGQKDVPLDDAGIVQAKDTAEYVLNHYTVDSVYSSDLCRAYDTVKPIADALDKQVMTCKDLREVDVGNWTGVPFAEVAEKYPEKFAAYKQAPGLNQFRDGESFAEVRDRALRAMAEIAAQNEGKTVVVGTHGGVIRILRGEWTGVGLDKLQDVPHVPNCSVTVVDYENGRANILLVGYNDHLTQKDSEAKFQ